MKLYWICEKARKDSEFRIAKDIDDLLHKKSEELDKEFTWVKNNFECKEIREVDGYRIVLQKISKPVRELEDKVWIEEIQETFK
jgi:hypothetical protein